MNSSKGTKTPGRTKGLSAWIAACAVGFGVSVPAWAKDETIPLDAVPPAVLEAALRAAPGLVLTEAEIESGKPGLLSYEIEGLVSGVEVEIDIDPSGVILEIERGDDKKKAKRSTALDSARRTDARTAPLVRGSWQAPRTDPAADLRRLTSTPDLRSTPRLLEVDMARVFDLPTPEAEIVAAAPTSRGFRTWVVSPVEGCDAREASSLAVNEWSEDLTPVRERVVDLGPGEATSVAALPGGEAAVVAIKNPTRPNVAPGRVDVLGLKGRRASAIVGPGPDSIAVSADGRFVVVACEASAPDPEDCQDEEESDDRPGSIHVLAFDAPTSSLRTVAVVEGERIFSRYLEDAPERAGDARDIEPEFVAIAPDSSLGLITLQEQSAVVVLDLRALTNVAGDVDVRTAGDRALAGLVLLPHDLEDERGSVRGVHPDGIAISPDGSIAVTANEAHPRARELQGFSILDLRGGPRAVRLVSTDSIFGLDPSLQRDTSEPRRKRRKLPRLDPEGVTFLDYATRTIAAIAIERAAPDEPSGSVVFVDLTGALDGKRPSLLARRLVGSPGGARPEGITATAGGRLVFVACERDGGTLSHIAVRGIEERSSREHLGTTRP